MHERLLHRVDFHFSLCRCTPTWINSNVSHAVRQAPGARLHVEKGRLGARAKLEVLMIWAETKTGANVGHLATLHPRDPSTR